MRAVMKTKICFKCAARKPLASFYVHAKMADGHLNKCKACTLSDVKNRPAEAKRAVELKRSKKPERIAKQVEYTRRHRHRWPGKNAARVAVRRAVVSGVLTKSPCKCCGSSVRLQAHHHDYRKKLDVEWLCFDCHRKHAHQ